MIDISTIKLFSVIGGSVAVLAMLASNVQQRTEADAKAEVAKVIESYIKGGDLRNVDQLNTVLHHHFRVVANQLMGSSTINVITKEQYLSLIVEAKLGGDTRAIDIQSVEILGKNASAKVEITGRALKFESFYHLIQNENGQWQLLQDLPFANKI